MSQLSTLGEPVAAVLMTAELIDAASTRDTITSYIRQQNDAVTRLEMSANGCTCDLCGTLAAFLTNKDRRTLGWPLAKDGRQHVHSRIDDAELPVTHVTRRQGRPYTLVLAKTDALFARERSARAKDEVDLTWLASKWRTAAAR